VGVGLIPGGGGNERSSPSVFSDSIEEGGRRVETRWQNAFMTIATAKVATSAEEKQRELGILEEA